MLGLTNLTSLLQGMEIPFFESTKYAGVLKLNFNISVLEKAMKEIGNKTEDGALYSHYGSDSKNSTLVHCMVAALQKEALC